VEQLPFNHTGFRAFLSQHKLMGSRCAQCGEIFLPPRPLCPHCYGTQMEWIELSGAGELAGFTTIYVGLPAMAAQGFDRQHPYCTGVIRLAEGPLISGQLIDVDCAHPEDIRVGLPVQAAYIEHRDSQEKNVNLAFKVL
jgi:scaffold protein (connect acetoacetyl-CoA thiolase and HMG-CoA synthase)